jgi:hypothetical protein
MYDTSVRAGAGAGTDTGRASTCSAARALRSRSGRSRLQTCGFLRIAVGFALLTLSCATQQTTPAAAPAVVANPAFKRVRVSPKDLTRDQLTTIMRSFTQALGVRCGECHVVTATEPREQFDFASDAKSEKLAARVMIQTTMELNNRWIPRVESAEGKVPEPGRRRRWK